MKKLSPKLISVVVITILSFMFLSGCGAPKLSGDFKEAEVKKAAENVINMISTDNSAGLKDICTVQMKNALTDDVLKQIFAAIDEGGPYEKIEAISIAGQTDKNSKEEFAVAVVKAKYQIKTFTYTISFTKQMKLAGLYYK